MSFTRGAASSYSEEDAARAALTAATFLNISVGLFSTDTFQLCCWRTNKPWLSVKDDWRFVFCTAIHKIANNYTSATIMLNNHT